MSETTVNKSAICVKYLLFFKEININENINEQTTEENDKILFNFPDVAKIEINKTNWIEIKPIENNNLIFLLIFFIP